MLPRSPCSFSLATREEQPILRRDSMRSFFFTFVLALALSASAAATRWNNPPKQKIEDLKHGTFRSAAMKAEVGYNICLPPQYDKDTKQRFPVIYYLHGYEGHESSYLDYAKYWRDAVQRFGPVILVFVNGGETSFFSDSPDGKIAAETLLVKELVPHLDTTYRTATNAAGRSLHGYSMGGFGALKLAFKHPDTFGSAVAYGATLADAAEFKKHLGKVFSEMFGNDAKRFADNDPFTLAERNAEKIRSHVAIHIVVGSKDDFLERHRALHSKFQQLKIPHGYEEIRGAGHNKDDLYKPAALRALQFSLQRFDSTPSRSLDKH
jgi:S-formylglutathione hydrolase FrmB